MATTTTSPAGQSRTAETLERTEQLESSLRQTAIEDVRSLTKEFLDWEPGAETLQILTLRDILMWANSHSQNVLSGVAIVLGREEHNAIFVSDDHTTAAERFVAALKGVDSNAADWEKRMSLIERIITLRGTYLEDVGWALEAIEGNFGDATPEEDFICSLLMTYGNHELDPGSLNRAIRTLGLGLRDLAKDAARFAKRFPNGYDIEQEWPVLTSAEEEA